MNDLKRIINNLIQFRDERDWKQFHTIENLSKSIVIEATELLELVQWDKEYSNTDEIGQELADIFNYVLLLADNLNIDIVEEVLKKIELNKQKYPIAKAYGTSKKYNKL